MKGEENLVEVVKHKKYLASLNISEYEAIKFNTFSNFALDFCGVSSLESQISDLFLNTPSDVTNPCRQF